MRKNVKFPKADPSLTVLESFPIPKPTTNPYLIMLGRELENQPGISILNFTWKTALLRRYDVFHVHWPEIMVNGTSPLKKAVRQTMTLMLLVKLMTCRIPIVRTVHNIRPPKDISKREELILGLIDRATALRIGLNPSSKLPGREIQVTIVHGHFIDWFANENQCASITGRLVYTGFIRRYKGVERLIQALQDLDRGQDFTLVVRGKPSSSELAASISSLAMRDARITLDLTFLSDSDLVLTITSSELVVLPYQFMHNSSAVLAALSLNRPVLVPRNEVNDALSQEVGEGWIYMFDGEISAADIVTAVGSLRSRGRVPKPDLTGRGWDKIASDHVKAFNMAVKMRAIGT